MDGADGVPVPALAHYRNKAVATMSREELVDALNHVWRAYVAINQRTMGGDPLTALPEHDVEALEDTLRQWFYGPHTTQPHNPAA